MDMTSALGRRRQRRSAIRSVLAIGAVVCPGVAACSSDDSADDSSGTPDVSPGGPVFCGAQLTSAG